VFVGIPNGEVTANGRRPTRLAEDMTEAEMQVALEGMFPCLIGNEYKFMHTIGMRRKLWPLELPRVTPIDLRAALPSQDNRNCHTVYIQPTVQVIMVSYFHCQSIFITISYTVC
jgi:hypothetical protein